MSRYTTVAYAEGAGKCWPTEAEWEKAARGGLAGQKFLVWSLWGYMYPIRMGLYGMADQVWEWCLDEYDQYF